MTSTSTRSRRGAGPTPAVTVTADSQLMEDYLQTAGIFLDLDQTSGNRIAPFQNADGQDEAIIIDSDGSLAHVYREPLSDSGWNMCGVGAGIRTMAAVDSTTLWAVGSLLNIANGPATLWQYVRGRWTQFPVELPSGQPFLAVSAGTDGTVWATDINDDLFVMGAGSAQPPAPLGATVTPATVIDLNGLAHLFCVDKTGSLWTISQSATTGGWGAWTPLAAPAGVEIVDLAVALNADGRLQVFIIGDDREVHTIWETTPGVWSWWDVLAPLGTSGPLASIAAVQNQDGRLEVFAIGATDGDVRHIWQTAPNNGWGGWATLTSAGAVLADLVAVRDAAGRLNVIASSARSHPLVRQITQMSPGSSWGNWVTVGNGSPNVSTIESMAVVATPTLGLHVIVAGQLGSGDIKVLHAGMQSTDGPWHAWSSHGTPPGGSPAKVAMAQDPNGDLEVFVLTGDGSVSVTTGPIGGKWVPWRVVGSAAGTKAVSLALARGRTGSLELFATTAANEVQRIQQSAPGSATWGTWMSSWWAWTRLVAPPMAVPPTGSGDNCWAIGTDGMLRHWTGSAWVTEDQQADSVSVGADGTVWIETGGALNCLNPAVQVPLPPGGAKDISCGSATDLWAAGNSGSLYLYRNGEWQRMSAPQFVGAQRTAIYTPQLSVVPGAVWLLDQWGTLWQRTEQSPWQWSAVPSPAGAAFLSSLTAAEPGSAWAVDSLGRIWYGDGRWNQVTALPGGATARQVAAGAGGTVWAIDSSGNPYQYLEDSGEWQSVAPSVLPPLRAAPTSWALGDNGTIWQYTDGTWSQFFHELPGATMPSQVVADAEGNPWAVGVDGRLYRYMAAQSAWQQVGGAPSDVVQVAVLDADAIWAITQTGSDGTFALDQSVAGSWVQLAGAPVMTQYNAAPQVSVGSDGTVWLVDGFGIPRTINWEPTTSTWTPKKAGEPLRSVAATTRPGEAWAVGADGRFWRTFGSGWTDADTPLPGAATAAEVSVGTDGTVWTLDDAGRLYTRSVVASNPVLPAFTIGVRPVVLRDATGELQLFCAGMDGTVWASREGGSNAWWDGFVSLGSPGDSTVPAQSLGAGLDANGCLYLFAVVVGSLWRVAQTAPGSGWGSWSSVGAPAGVSLVDVSVASQPQGGLLVAAMAGDGTVHTFEEGAPGVWSWDAQPVPQGVAVAALSVGFSPTGCAEICAIGTDGAAHHVAQASAGGGWAPSWTAWGLPPGVTRLTTQTVGSNLNGNLQFFAISEANTLHTRWESAPGAWSDWTTLTPLPGALVESLAVGLNGTGCMVIAAVGTDQTVQVISQTAPNNGWGSWSSALGTPAAGGPLTNPVVAQGSSGPLEVFVVAERATPVLWTTSIANGTGSTAGGWVSLEQAQPMWWRPVDEAPALEQAPSGSAAYCWSIDANGNPVESGRGGWSAAPLPGSPTPAAASVSLGADLTVWAVTRPATDGTTTTYQRVNDEWKPIGVDDLVRAPEGRADSLWCVSVSGGVCRSLDGGLTWWEDIAFAGDARQLDVGPDGSVWLLDADGTSWSDVAWQRPMRPTGMAGLSGWQSGVKVDSIAAALDQNGVPNLVFLSGGGLYYSTLTSADTWTMPQSFLYEGEPIWFAGSFGLTKQQDTGELVVYTVPESPMWAGMSMAVSTTSVGLIGFGLMTTCPATLDGQPLPAPPVDVELRAVDADHWYWFAVAPEGSKDAGGLIAAVASRQAPAPSFHAVTAAQGATAATLLERFVRLPWAIPADAPYTVMTDTQSNILLASLSTLTVENGAYTGNFLTLTDASTPISGSVSSVAAILQAGSGAPAQPRLYALAPLTRGSTPVLWIRRLVDPSVPVFQTGAWGPWIPLGDDFFSLAGGSPLLNASTLFAVGRSDTSLHSLTQDKAAGGWSDLEVRRPSLSGPEVVRTPVYRTQVTVEIDGNPAADVPVVITAETPVLIWLNGEAYSIDAARSVTCHTNAWGKLTAQTVATDLATPQLRFQPIAPGGPSGPTGPGGWLTGGALTISPNQHVHDFLAGKGQLPVGGGQPQSFAAETLKNATVNGQSLNPNLSLDAAQTAVTVTGQLLQLAGGTSETSWSADLSDPTRPTFQTFADSAAFRAHHQKTAERVTTELGFSFNPIDWGEDAVDAAEDIYHGIANGIAKATEVAYDAANGLVSITIAIAGQIVGVVDTVIDTVSDALNAIGSVINTIVSAIEEFIQWLEWLLQWEDIWETKQKLQQLLGWTLGNLQAQLGAFEGKVQGWLDTLKTSVGQSFDTVIDFLRSESFPYQSFGDIQKGLPDVSESGAPRDQAAARSSAPPPSFDVNSVVANPILDKVLDNLTSDFTLGSVPGLKPEDLWTTLNAQNIVSDIQVAAADFISWIQALVANPSDFAELTIVAFFTELKDLVIALIDVVEGVADAVIEFAAQLLGGIYGSFNHRLDIPVVSDLYEWVTTLLGVSEDLTVLHLFSLLIAVPLTTMYKAFQDGLPLDGLPEASPPGALAAPTMTEAEQLKWCFLCNGFGALLIAGTRDALTSAFNPDVPVVGIAKIASAVLSAVFNVDFIFQQVFSWPGGPGNFEPSTTLEISEFVNWAMYWVPTFADYGFLVASFLPDFADVGVVAAVRFMVQTVAGAVILGSAVEEVVVILAEGVTTDDTANIVFALCKPIPLLMGFLLIPAYRDAVWQSSKDAGTPIDTAWIKNAVDVVILDGLPIAHFVSS